ncbi:hepatoma-derived growth factor, related protein 2, isoform CRA_d [Rattus norvegicus]|uniref:Hepatoma-derived growth factor, related protein 2, isoform CRA_d n=1 Tax=Rattus norvegicus TaxID=10116 RepID=A6KR01_RAT|nr:hepatoma-derived growth factor, related protein 2, isoform CRA_d [Rattus norvegicus]
MVKPHPRRERTQKMEHRKTGRTWRMAPGVAPQKSCMTAHRTALTPPGLGMSIRTMRGCSWPLSLPMMMMRTAELQPLWPWCHVCPQPPREVLRCLYLWPGLFCLVL